MLIFSEEVEEELGASHVAQLRKHGVESRCPVDGFLVSSTHDEDISVVIERYIDSDIIRFAHASCVDSRIIFIGTAAPSAGGEDVEFVSILLPTVRGHRAILIFVPQGLEQTLIGESETFSPYTALVLGMGWDLIAAVGKPPTFDSGWVLTVDLKRETGEIRDASGQSVLDRFTWSDPRWVVTALTAGVDVFTGTFAVDRIMNAKNPALALQALARNGELLGGKMHVVESDAPAPTYVEQLQEAGKQAAHLLERAVEQRAPRPGRRNARLFGTHLPLAPQVTPTRSDDTCLLLVDLNEPDHAVVDQFIAQCHAYGIPASDFEKTGNLLEGAPEGWSAGLWQNQVKVFARLPGKKVEVAFFERFPNPGRDWYLAATRRGAIGIIIGNGLPKALDEDVLLSKILSGDWLGFAVGVLGMTSRA